MSKRKIYFRADASADIGYGHFIRTLALADMLKDDFKCIFVTQSPTEYQRSEVSKVCALVEMPATDGRFGMFLDLLEGDEIVVLDNYFYDTDYQRAIRDKGCQLVCIDDMHDKHYVADVVINHGLTDASLFSVESYTRLCLGMDWALLRSPFLEINPTKVHLRNTVKKIVLNFGGVDKWDLTGRVAAFLLSRLGITRITAIVGDAYQHSYIYDQRVCYKKNLSSEEIAKTFLENDFAILPASTISFEALACGIPLASGYFVDNQIEIYHELLKNNSVLPLGDFLDKKLDEKLREVLNREFPEVWDKGNIGERYLRLFKSLDVKNYQIGGYCFIDYCNLSEIQHQEVWQARTDDRIRCWMKNPDYFSFESHLHFVDSLHSSSEKKYWAVYKKGCFMGSVNIHRINTDGAERGIFMNPCLIGKEMAQEIEECSYSIYHDLHISFLKAEVKKGNLRSLKYHLKIGYMIESENENFYFLKKVLSND